MLSVIFIVTIKSELRRSVKILIQGVLYTPKIRRGMMARLYLGTSLFWDDDQDDEVFFCSG